MSVRINVPLRVVVYPAEDVPGQWISHCLELDLVSQGDSQEHALAMMREAVDTLIRFNLAQGFAPVQVNPAPREMWKAYGLDVPEALDLNTTVRTTVPTADGTLEPQEPELPEFIPIVRERPPVFVDTR